MECQLISNLLKKLYIVKNFKGKILSSDFLNSLNTTSAYYFLFQGL